MCSINHYNILQVFQSIMDPFKISLISSFSSSSSSSSSDEEEMMALVSLFEANQSSMMEIVEQDMEQPKKRGGSVLGRKYIKRERKKGHDRLFADYFAQEPVYNATIFRRRFRMERHVFVRILNAIETHNPFFVQKIDACNVVGLSSLQKMTAAIRMLAYGLPADAIDEYVRIGESTAILSLKHFCQSVIDIFEAEYLRVPRPDDVARLLTIGEARGFPGMLGSLDCMHWKWKNCPTAWQGQYSGHIKKPTIILEAVASQDLWIWHAFFGMPGSHNDLNVLDRSPLFSDLAQGRAPPAVYTINGHTYNMGYYLADGIYPPWSTLVQTISSPDGPKKKYFADKQEAARKDVERAFGVLQARFAIVRGPARAWDLETLSMIMKTCIILHNMIVEDEREGYPDFEYETSEHNPSIEVSRDLDDDFESFVSRHIRIRDADTHYAIRNDLIEHLWQRYGDN